MHTSLINVYSVIQKVKYDGKKGVSQPDIDSEDIEDEWKLNRRFIFRHCKENSLNQVLLRLINQGDITAAFPNLSKLHVAAIVTILPVTIAAMDCTFSSMKQIKTRFLSRMGEDILQHTMCICIERPEKLSNDTLEMIVDNYKVAKSPYEIIPRTFSRSPIYYCTN